MRVNFVSKQFPLELEPFDNIFNKKTIVGALLGQLFLRMEPLKIPILNKRHFKPTAKKLHGNQLLSNEAWSELFYVYLKLLEAKALKFQWFKICFDLKN